MDFMKSLKPQSSLSCTVALALSNQSMWPFY
jgi:hypothetical protein